MPAGLVRPGSSPAASLTVDWQLRVLISVVGWVPAPAYWGPVAELQPSDGMSDIPIGHTQSIANPGVLAVIQRRVYENHCGNLTIHTHDNQCSESSVAVLAHSAAELVENDFHRPQAISNLASNFLGRVEPVDAKVGHPDRPPTVFLTVAAQVEGHSDWVRGVEARGIFVLPTVAGYHDFPTGAGYLANALFLMQTRTLPGPGNAPYASVSTHG